MKKLLLLAGLALMVCSASAKKPAQKTQEEGYKFTDLTTVPTTSVKEDRKSTRLNSSHQPQSRMPSSA